MLALQREDLVGRMFTCWHALLQGMIMDGLGGTKGERKSVTQFPPIHLERAT